MANIRIHGHQFTIDDPYSEGHTINEAEASTLNKTFMENIGNNFRAKIKDAGEEHGIDFAKGEKLPDSIYNALHAEFEKVATDYEFGVRSASIAGTRDPVRTEALRLARQPIKEAIRNAIATGKIVGKTMKDYTPEAITAAAEKYLNGPHGEAILARAERNISEKRSMSTDALAALPE